MSIPSTTQQPLLSSPNNNSCTLRFGAMRGRRICNMLTTITNMLTSTALIAIGITVSSTHEVISGPTLGLSLVGLGVVTAICNVSTSTNTIYREAVAEAALNNQSQETV